MASPLAFARGESARRLISLCVLTLSSGCGVVPELFTIFGGAVDGIFGGPSPTSPANPQPTSQPAGDPVFLTPSLWPGPDHIRHANLPADGTQPAAVGSMTTLENDGFYAMTDYRRIWMLNRGKETFEPFKTDPAIALHPAGICYSRTLQLLFLANFQQNNVLAFTVDMSAPKLELAFQISDADMIGPEGIAVTEGGDRLLVANQDGHSLVAYDLTDSSHPQIWKVPIPQAHGVCIVGDRVYCTSMVERSIRDIVLATGEVLKTRGDIGIDPEQDQHLWPAWITSVNQDELVVTDGHAGFVCVLDRATLSLRHYFGGNGPSLDYFHNPGGIIVDRGEYVLGSIYQKRLLFGQVKDWTANDVLLLRSDAGNWEWMRGSGLKATATDTFASAWTINASGWGYECPSENVALFGDSYDTGYGRLLSRDGNRPNLNLPNPDTLYNDSGYFYFTRSLALGDAVVLFAHASSSALYCEVVDGVQFVFPLHLRDNDVWMVNGGLADARGPVDLMSDAASRAAWVQYVHAGPDTPERTKRLIDALSAIDGANYQSVDLYDELQSTPGAALRAVLESSTDEAEIAAAAQAYFQEAQLLDIVNVAEYAIAEMITGATPAGS